MPNSVLDFDKKGSSKRKQPLEQQNAQRIEQTAHSLKIKTGFSSTPGVTLSFNNGTRTFTITPSGSTFDYWIEGIKYTKTSADTVVIDDTEGLWYIYYMGTVLTASQVEWVIKDGDKALVGLIHWDATNNVAIYLGYECHSHDMPPATHSYLHRTIGTNYVSGLALVEGTGADDGKVAMDSGEIRDEDIHIDVTDGAGAGLFEQELGNISVFAPAQIPVFYRSGASAWRKYTAGDYPFYDNSGVDNVHYNSYSAPNWASTAAATSAKYIAYWIFGTNDQNEPIIAIMGQVESLTLNVAKEANTLEGITWGTLPFQEMKILYRLIFKSDSTHSHTEDLRQVINVPGGTYVPAPSEVSNEVYSSTWEDVTTLAPSKKAVYDKIETLNLKFPIGAIMMFSGAWTDNVTISGWYKCDGNNGTVNLVDKFIRGGATSGATGGSDNAIVVSHAHDFQWNEAGTGIYLPLRQVVSNVGINEEGGIVLSTGVSGTDKNIPAYYTLIFIQRIS